MNELKGLFILLNNQLYIDDRDNFISSLKWVIKTIEEAPSPYLTVIFTNEHGFEIRGTKTNPMDDAPVMVNKPND